MDITKPTFERVFKDQEKLRVKLQKLIDENRCLKDETERAEFMSLLAHSTLGLGVKQIVKFNVPMQYGFFVAIDTNVENTARWLCYQNENLICVPHKLYASSSKSKPLPISLVWQCLLDNLFDVFPLALDRAIGMSREIPELYQDKDYFNDIKEGEK